MAYIEPTAADLKARYPAFAAVDDATIEYWLTDAHRYVDQTWMEMDYGPALIAVAAHNMVKAGAVGVGGGDIGGMAASGVTSFRSGAFQAEFSDKAVEKAIGDDWDSTTYGAEYLRLLRRNKMGMGVTAPGRVPPYCWADGPFPPC